MTAFYAWDSNPSHSSAANEAWYWPKRILHSGWLCITSRPIFKGRCGSLIVHELQAATVPWLTNAAWHVSRPLAVLHASTNSVPKPKHMALVTLVHGFTAISVIPKDNCSIYGVLEGTTPNLFRQQREQKKLLQNGYTFDTVYKQLCYQMQQLSST